MRSSALTLSRVRQLGAALVLLALFQTPLRADDSVLPIEIQCSPSTVVLHAVRMGNWLTVHTDILYAAVVKASVTLEVEGSSLNPYTTFADDCGNLVAKFKMSEVKPLLNVGMNTLTLVGQIEDPEAPVAFAGSDSVRVKK